MESWDPFSSALSNHYVTLTQKLPKGWCRYSGLTGELVAKQQA